MHEETTDGSQNPTALTGTLKLVAVIAVALSGGLLALWAFDAIQTALLLDLIGKTWLLALVVASAGCVIAWLMRLK